MKVVSLFDGISCGMVALKRAGVNVERYDAYEIDSNAIMVSKTNFPEINQCGDVYKAQYKEGEYDLLIGGSPCTFWSIAKGSNGRQTESVGEGFDLLMQYVRAFRKIKPKWFLYENNDSISQAIKDEISTLLGVQPVVIDSADFSAQIRKRCYWTNIPFLKDWEKSEIVMRDILYNEESFKVRDFSKYADTVKWNAEHTICRYDSSGKGWYSQQARARSVDIKMNTLPASGVDKNNIYLGDYKLRTINCVECERLQTLPDNYTACLKSKALRHRAIGNGWTVDVVAHIFRGLNNG